jgi:hypothetical protein
MGCNCGKGKKQVLNNLNSKDHLRLASETFKTIIEQRTIEEYTDFDKIEIMGVYKSLYPNQRVEPTLSNAVHYITDAHNRYISK